MCKFKKSTLPIKTTKMQIDTADKGFEIRMTI